MRSVEFYPRRQGRPYSPPTVDLETRRTYGDIKADSLWEEYVEMKEMLEKLLNEQIQKTQQMLVELEQIKLHLASISGESISEEDVDNKSD